MLVTYLLLLLAAAARPKRGPFPGSKNQRCPPACANNELTDLLDRHCSDKGTAFMSKHHYSSAYHAIFGSIRGGVRSLLEIGIGEDQAPSVASWSAYFPHAQARSHRGTHNPSTPPALVTPARRRAVSARYLLRAHRSTLRTSSR